MSKKIPKGALGAVYINGILVGTFKEMIAPKNLPIFPENIQLLEIDSKSFSLELKRSTKKEEK